MALHFQWPGEIVVQPFFETVYAHCLSHNHRRDQTRLMGAVMRLEGEGDVLWQQADYARVQWASEVTVVDRSDPNGNVTLHTFRERKHRTWRFRVGFVPRCVSCQRQIVSTIDQLHATATDVLDDGQPRWMTAERVVLSKVLSSG